MNDFVNAWIAYGMAKIYCMIEYVYGYVFGNVDKALVASQTADEFYDLAIINGKRWLNW